VFILKKILGIIRNNEGAAAIEYGLIASLIAVAALASMQSIGSALNESYSNIAAAL
jgi:pilus assembly protein Flp/PilA